jgi:hypothetical protein
MIYETRKKNGKKGHRNFLFVERILSAIVLYETAVDSPSIVIHKYNRCRYVNINSGCTYELLLIVEYQKQFHIEALLILDPINSGPACGLKSVGKFLFPSHAAAVRLPKRLEYTPLLLGPIVATSTGNPSSPPSPPPCRDPFVGTAVEEQGAPARKCPDLTPPCRIVAPVWTDASPDVDSEEQGAPERSKDLTPPPHASISNHHTGEPPLPLG